MTQTNTELALIRSVAQARANFQAALALGAGPDIFPQDGTLGTRWQQIAALYERDIDPMAELLPGDASRLFDGEPVTPEQTAELFKKVLRAALGRDLSALAARLANRANRQSISTILPWVRSEIARVESRYVRATQPKMGNPADALARSRAWSMQTGLGIIDNWMRLTSGEIHIITGDPGAGKTTMAIAIAANAALKKEKPVLYLTAETDPTEIQLSMLTQRGVPGFDVRFVNRVRFDPNFRIERNIDKVRQAWDKTFSNMPLTIIRVSGGPDEALAIISALTEPHLIEIDHLYALISQTSKEMPEYRQYIMFCAALLIETVRMEHLSIAWNQFKIEGRKGEKRKRDDGFGGSGVANISGSMLNVWHPKNELVTSNGYRQILTEWVKFRTLLVEDENGQLIDPAGKVNPCWIENRYRRFVDDIQQETEFPEIDF